MSVGVLPGSRLFHWESASKPALNRCVSYRNASTSPIRKTTAGATVSQLPSLHHNHYPCPRHHYPRHRHHRHHRARRRHFFGESPPPLTWPRRSSEVTPPSIASSWHTDTSSLLTSDSLTLSDKDTKGTSTDSDVPRHYSSSNAYFRVSTRRDTPLSISSDSFFLSQNTVITTRMSSSSSSSAGVPRTTGLDSAVTSTAAAREVKQYLNRTLFPRPSSTLHGYASLYQRLKQLPASHRRVLQRGVAGKMPSTLPHPDSGSASGGRQGGGGQRGEGDLEEVESLERNVLPSPPRVEIHIYVPTAAAAAAAAAATAPGGSNTSATHEDDTTVQF